MATGDLHLLGTLYTGNIKRLLPTNPVSGQGDVTAFTAGQTIEIRDTDANDAYKLRWREVVVEAKRSLIADRNILHSMSWSDLNSRGLVAGKVISIDGKQYLLRLMTGGSDYRNSNDPYAGGTPTANEWDQIISGEANYPGLPKPLAQDLTNNSANLNGAHNQYWNWYRMASLVQEAYQGGAQRIRRGANALRDFRNDAATSRLTYGGWRPVLEVLHSPPNLSPNINGVYRKYADGHVNINGVWRKIDSIHANINGVWRKS